jgi:hypothetical protein
MFRSKGEKRLLSSSSQEDEEQDKRRKVTGRVLVLWLPAVFRIRINKDNSCAFKSDLVANHTFPMLKISV